MASNLEAARSQMAFTLGFHIILASLGVALPALMLIANYRGLRRNDAAAMTLAQRWSKAAAVAFAVGAVTGTVLSFEFGLLWPAFTGRFGPVFGVLFAIEGIFFFLEAIFLAIYMFGWKRLSPWAHFWSGVPVVISGFGGAFAVVAVNSWMNQPQGYAPATGKVTSVEPWKVIFNPAVPYEVPHMILAAYLVTGFIVASIYAVGMLRGRHDRVHLLGLLIPLTVASIATPIQFVVGDTAARAIAKDQPIKFAAMECVQKTSTDVTEYIFGRCTATGVKGGIGIPGFDSVLVGGSTSTQVIGLDTVPPQNRPPDNTLLHWSFDAMVGICTLLIGLGVWLAIGWWRKIDFARSKWFLRATALSGAAAVVALEAGWIVTEVGRQPWIVQNVMRTSDAVTQADGIWVTFVLILLLYVVLGATLIIVLLAMSRRWREAGDDETTVPYGPEPPPAALTGSPG
jgi:cytochrome d ubiquinol oxidase subunit I